MDDCTVCFWFVVFSFCLSVVVLLVALLVYLFSDLSLVLCVVFFSSFVSVSLLLLDYCP